MTRRRRLRSDLEPRRHPLDYRTFVPVRIDFQRGVPPPIPDPGCERAEYVFGDGAGPGDDLLVEFPSDADPQAVAAAVLRARQTLCLRRLRAMRAVGMRQAMLPEFDDGRKLRASPEQLAAYQPAGDGMMLAPLGCALVPVPSGLPAPLGAPRGSGEQGGFKVEAICMFIPGMEVGQIKPV